MAGKYMLAQGGKFSGTFQVEVMNHSQRVRPGLDQVEGVLVPFPALAPTRGGSPALHDDDPAVAVMTGEKIQ